MQGKFLLVEKSHLLDMNLGDGYGEPCPINLKLGTCKPELGYRLELHQLEMCLCLEALVRIFGLIECLQTLVRIVDLVEFGACLKNLKRVSFDQTDLPTANVFDLQRGGFWLWLGDG